LNWNLVRKTNKPDPGIGKVVAPERKHASGVQAIVTGIT
jgi:hypothetical protein